MKPNPFNLLMMESDHPDYASTCIIVKCKDIYILSLLWFIAIILDKYLCSGDSTGARLNSVEESSDWACKPAYLVPVTSQDKLGGLRQEGHTA